jgi:acetyltransferase-like isoleucine patch superfamily enzyme
MSGTELTPVVVPRVNVNEDSVTISWIAVEPGTKVAKDDVLFTMATSKAEVEVGSEGEGHFWPSVDAGATVAVGAIVGYLTASAAKPAALPRPDPPSPSGSSARATKKAEALAVQLGVDLAALAVEGIIRERDVQAFADRAKRAAPRVEPVERADVGRVEPAFLAEIGRPDSGFASLSSALKVLSYRSHGAVVGRDVSFEPGSLVVAERMSVGDGCQFGARTVIRAEVLRLGVGCLFGHDNDIMCRRIEIGDMLFLVNRVLIGQGGAFGPDAALIVGHSCLISSDTLINTTHRVTIGDRSCLSPRVSIYTHSHWQNVLEGYHATLAPVSIGDDVWITGNCLVTPGTFMEDGSQALAGSVVSGRVEARTVVSGVPAQVVGRIRGEIGAAEKDRIMRRIWGQLESVLRRAGIDPSAATYAGLEPDARSPASVQVAFGPAPAGYSGTYFDLSAYRVSGPDSRVADEVRNFLRKQGIRFEPHVWRYRGDVGRFNA